MHEPEIAPAASDGSARLTLKTVSAGMRTAAKTASTFAMVVLILAAASCDRQAWMRGQPASPAALLERGHENLNSALEEHGSSRPDITETVRAMHDKLGKDAAPEIKEALAAAQPEFENLEGKLSIGSRAAYGELSGQLRRVQTASPEAATLLASRILMFLASELSVPAPVIPPEAPSAGGASGQPAETAPASSAAARQ